MKQHLNLATQDLHVGYWFKVHNSTVIHGIFTCVINMLFVKLKPLMKWPERDALIDNAHGVS